MQIREYTTDHKDMWDDLVVGSKNGTFLFLRDYMDYHRDRFHDLSLLVFDDREQVIAVIPGNLDDGVFTSHGGLTYGGFVTDERMRTGVMLTIFEKTLAFLKDRGVSSWIYKCVPYIFHRLPAEEDLYALFRVGANLYRRDVSSAIDRSNRIHYQDRRRRSIKKAVSKKVTCRLTNDYASFWSVLEENLASVYDKKPVHSLSEIESLRRTFTNNIRLFGAFLGDQMIAGTVVYETECVAHVQYIASSHEAREIGALDMLFDSIITGTYASTDWFNFGISTESDGRILNNGLIDYKEGFGARAVAYDTYRLDF